MPTLPKSYPAHTTAPRTSVVNKTLEKKQKNGDEIWDELLNSPESDAFLKKLSEKTHQDYRSGLTEEGGFDDR